MRLEVNNSILLLTVYPTGSMLEMSNGYPSSPLGASPSPSPGLGGHHSKSKLVH